jgi:hypothetical protein
MRIRNCCALRAQPDKPCRGFLTAFERADDFVDHTIIDQGLQGGGCLHESLRAYQGTVHSARCLTDTARNGINKEWVESQPRTVRRALASTSPFGDAANIFRKRIEINANLLFLLVPGRGTKLCQLL